MAVRPGRPEAGEAEAQRDTPWGKLGHLRQGLLWFGCLKGVSKSQVQFNGISAVIVIVLPLRILK